MNKSAPVLISGAGVAGLTAAIWLGRAGFRPIVIEQAQDIRADGYIVSLSHRSYRFAQKLGLLSELRARGAGVRASSYHRAGNGALLELDYERLFSGVEVVQIMRDDLQDILYSKARELAEFRFGTSINAIKHGEEQAQVALSDGSHETFEVVIGADGLHSAVRSASFNNQAVEHHYLGLCSAAYDLPNILALEHKFETHMERDRYVVVFTTPKKRLATVFVWSTTMREAPSSGERHTTLLEAYVDTPPFVRQILNHCPTDGMFYMDPLIQVRMRNWYQGQSVLVGDAAHCMTLISGQGATMAFTGACVLAEKLVDYSPANAFLAYQNELAPIVSDVQDRTRTIARWYVPRSSGRQIVRDLAMRLLPAAFFEKHFRNKYSRA